MNLVDFFIVFFVFFISISFSMKGFFNSFFTFLGWVVSSYVFTKRYLYIEKQFFNDDWDGNVNLISYITSGIIAIINLWVFYYIAHKIEKLLVKSGFSEGDRILGFIFGCFIGWYLIASIVFFANKLYPIDQLEVWKSSKLSEQLENTINQVCVFITVFIERWNKFNK